MKKTKLLMPLLGVSAIAAATIPAVVSCGPKDDSENKYNVQVIDQTTYIEGFEWKPEFAISNTERKDGEDYSTTISWKLTGTSISVPSVAYLYTFEMYLDGKPITQNTKTNNKGYVITGHDKNSISIRVPESTLSDVKNIVFIVTLDDSDITARTKQNVWTEGYEPDTTGTKYNCLHASSKIETISAGTNYIEFEADLNLWKDGMPDDTIYIGVFDSTGKRTIQSNPDVGTAYWTVHLGELDYSGAATISDGFIAITPTTGWGNKGNLSVLSGRFYVTAARSNWEVIVGVPQPQ